MPISKPGGENLVQKRKNRSFKGRGGRRNNFNKRPVTEEKLDYELENYWKKGGDEKTIKRFEEINESQRIQKEAKRKLELDQSLDEYWSKKNTVSKLENETVSK